MSQLASRAAVLAAQPLPEIAAAPDAPLAASAATVPPASGSLATAQAATPPAGDTAGDALPVAVKENGRTTAAASFAAKADAAAPATDANATAATLPGAPREGAQVAAKPLATTAHAGAPAPLPQSPANAGSLGGAVLALVLVVGLILLLSWLAKRMPGFGGAGRNASALRIVGSLALGPRERVVVVAVGDTQLLLGVGAGGTRTLHTLTEPLPVAAATKASPAFAQLLAQHFGKKP